MTTRFVTFYSFKGGVGRSQALANVALELANRGLDVVMVDFDLESPGLDRFFDTDAPAQSPGLVEWLDGLRRDPDVERKASDYIIDVTATPQRAGRLRLVRAGARGDEYARRVASIPWQAWYEAGAGYEALERLRAALVETAADVVLIDSRTGQADSSLVCTGQLPDVLVMQFALHEQGVEGTASMAAAVRRWSAAQGTEARLRQILFVPSRVDEQGNVAERDVRLGSATERLAHLGTVLSSTGERLSHDAYYAYRETLLDGRMSDTLLSRAHLALAGRIEEHLRQGAGRETADAWPLRAHRAVAEAQVAFERLGRAWNELQPLNPEALGDIAARAGAVGMEQTTLAQLWTRLGSIHRPLVDGLDGPPSGLGAWSTALGQVEERLAKLEREHRSERTSVARVELRSAGLAEAEVQEILTALEPDLDAPEAVFRDRVAALAADALRDSLARRLDEGQLELAHLRAAFPVERDRLAWVDSQLTLELETLESLRRARYLLPLRFDLVPQPDADELEREWLAYRMLLASAEETERMPLFASVGGRLWERAWRQLPAEGAPSSLRAEQDVVEQLNEVEQERPELLAPLVEHAIALLRRSPSSTLSTALASGDPVLRKAVGRLAEEEAPGFGAFSALALLRRAPPDAGRALAPELAERLLSSLREEKEWGTGAACLLALSGPERALSKNGIGNELIARWVAQVLLSSSTRGLAILNNYDVQAHLEASTEGVVLWMAIRWGVAGEDLARALGPGHEKLDLAISASIPSGLQPPFRLAEKPLVELSGRVVRAEERAREASRATLYRNWAPSRLLEEQLRKDVADRIDDLMSRTSAAAPSVTRLDERWITTTVRELKDDGKKIQTPEGDPLTHLKGALVAVSDALRALEELRVQAGGRSLQSVRDLSHRLRAWRDALVEATPQDSPIRTLLERGAGTPAAAPAPWSLHFLSEDLGAYDGVADTSQGRATPDRVLEGVLELKSGQASWDSLSERHLRDSRLVLAARTALKAKARAEQAARVCSNAQALLQDLRGRLERTEGTVAAEASSELALHLGQARQALAALPQSDGVVTIEAVAACETSAFDAAKSAVDLAEYAAELDRTERERSAADRRSRLDQYRRAAGAWIGQLLVHGGLDGALQQQVLSLHARLRVSLDRGDVEAVEGVLDEVRGVGQRLGIGEPERAADGGTSPGPARRMSDLRPEELSPLARADLDRAPPLETPWSEELDAVERWAWDRETSERLKFLALAQTKNTDDLTRAKATAAWLLLAGQSRLMDGVAYEASALFGDAWRWIQAHLSRRIPAASWESRALVGLLSSWLHPYERAHDAGGLAGQLRDAFAASTAKSLIERFVRAGVVGLIGVRAVALREASSALMDRVVLPALGDRPLELEQLARGIVGAVVTDTTHAYPLLLEVLGRGDPALATSASHARAHRPDSARTAFERVQQLAAPAETSTLLNSVLEEIAATRRWLSEPSSPDRLSMTLFTSRVHVTSAARFVVQISHTEGTETLRNLRLESSMVRGDERRALESVSLPELGPRGSRELTFRVPPDAAPGPVELALTLSTFGEDGTQRLFPQVRGLASAAQLLEVPSGPKPPNPYVVGVALKGGPLMFGREEVVDRIVRKLVGAFQDNAVIVLGERRIGKTTVLNAVEARPEIAQRYVVARVDLEHLTASEGAVGLYRDRILHAIHEVLRRSGVVDRGAVAFAQVSPHESFRRALAAIDDQLARRNRRVLLMIDEVERLLGLVDDGELPRETIAALRAGILESKNVSFLLSGLSEVVHRHTQHYDDRLFKLALEEELGPLPEDAAKALITIPTEKIFSLRAAARDRIVDETGAHPYLLQYVGHELVEAMLDRWVATVTETDVVEVLDTRILSSARPFSFLMDALRDRLDLRAVQAVAMYQRGSRGVPPADVRRGWARLGDSPIETDALVERLERIASESPGILRRRRPGYHLTVPLLASRLRFLAERRG